MVESSAGGPCRCACQGECSEEPSTCCSPHVFTSALLGALACVLMTGGVFLAFHRWDPLWLIVSAVGVVLVLIGSLLHCCGAREARAARRAALGSKGCCGRPLPDTHVLPNGGSLTEQLLPLSNARSVSQLSLNMLPGYFPPVVTTYGIEQHSAVVQNINRLVQQQQQQQQPSSPGSVSPSVANGKSFILLSLPGDTPQANIQNLVATVYQLDGNVVTEIPVTDGVVPTLSPVTPLPAATPAAPAPSLVLKNAEVQTCNVWPVPNPVPSSSCSISNAPLAIASTSTSALANAPAESPQPSTSSGTTQTEPLVTNAIDLMDCSPICDTPDIPVLPTNVLLPVRPDVPGPSRSDVPGPSRADIHGLSKPDGPGSPKPDVPGPSRLDIHGLSIPDVPGPSRPDTTPEPLSSLPDLPALSGGDVLVEIPASSSDVLIDISEEDCASAPPLVTSDRSEAGNDAGQSALAASVVAEPVDESLLGAVGGGSELSLSCDNLSDIDVDDGELMERSSPPPSYDDVAHEGLGYGTI